MIRNARLNRTTLAALIVAFSMVAFSPAAHAERGGHRSKQVDRGRWSEHRSRAVVYERGHSDVGPALVGLMGGLILGAALSQSQPVMVRAHECAPPPPCYRYVDAWSNRGWDSLDECTDAAWSYRGPRVIKVVDVRSGECVRTLYWKHDHWLQDYDRD